jgi:glycosyltransferase involved in cell wall biosynthesis
MPSSGKDKNISWQSEMKHHDLDVLIVTDMPFWRRGQGSFNRVAELHHALENKFAVGVYIPAYLRPDPSGLARWRADRQAPSHVLDRFGPVSNFSVYRMAWLFGDRLRRQIKTQKVSYIDNLSIKQSLINAALQRRPKAILFEFATLAPLAEALKAHPETCDIVRIVDTHDVRWKRAEDFRAAGIDLPDAWTRDEETRRLENFHILIGITDDDTAELEKMCPAAKTITTAHPVDLNVSASEGQIQLNSVPVVRVIASNMPTRKSLPFLLNEVWPLVRRRLDSRIRLEVVGRLDSDFGCGADDTIAFLPPTETIDDLFIPADIIVNPMICGSGLKIKNLEALAYAKPLITTSPGAQGMPDKATTGAFVVADEAEDLAGALVELAGNPVKRQSMSAEAKKYISRYFTRDVVYRDLFDCLNEIARK